MRFPRLLAVFLGVMLAFGAFGATVGGLIGISLPSSLSGPALEARPGDREPDLDRTSSISDPPVVRATRASDRRTGTQGAALGGALGLLLGVVLGVPIALLDQAILIGRTMLAKRPPPPPPPPA